MFLKRQYKLLKLISSEKKCFSTKEIALHLNCSIKTVQRDISQIKNYLPEGWSIQLVKNKGIYLVKPLNSSINTIKTIYLKHSLLFQTLNILLYKKIKTVDQLSDKLYVQNTKMRSILIDVEHYLKRYELTLKKRPLRIEGNETNIILMYYELYLKSYNSHEWPFNTFQQSIFNQLLLNIENILNIKFYKESIRKLSIFIGLYLIRKNHRFNITLEEKITKEIEQSFIYTKIKPIIINTFKTCNVKICNEDIIIIIIAINHAEYYCEKKETMKKNYLSFILEENKTLHIHLRELIYSLEKTFKMQLSCDDKFIFSIICTVKPHVYKSKTFIEKTFIKPTTIYIKNNHPKTFNTLNQTITQWLKNLNIEHHVSENAIADLTMHIEAINMQRRKDRKKIILFLDSGESWERYLTAFFNSYFKRKLDYLSISKESLLNTYSNCKNISCIITDTLITTPINSVPVIFISTVPTKRDLEELSKII
ncbi:HTH domain-containing protein [Bacillus thuringiensis]|uniref:helix-turn-helix domain-containing protein n=1 Tax=Bacillus thuringiensis TaxID=1428 RepID=UPI0010AD14EA|nr:helix-turn-helix domain-containing protein [Bacillus thuringiensis]TJZ99916.1 HTH domain-containing protein [Bacillus thuringiensis]